MVLNILLIMASGGVAGALLGLIPFLVGQSSGKPNLGRDGLLCCIGTGISVIFSWALPAVVVTFVIVIVCRDRDRGVSGQMAYPPVPPPPVYQELGIRCVSGPLMGQVFSVGPQGLVIGRENDCTVHFPFDQPGVSRHHCSVRRENGVLILTDLGSSHGTFLQNGIQLSPHYPTQLPPDSQFSLANSGIAFRVVII